jgi:hypothetical protein
MRNVHWSSRAVRWRYQCIVEGRTLRDAVGNKVRDQLCLKLMLIIELDVSFYIIRLSACFIPFGVVACILALAWAV